MRRRRVLLLETVHPDARALLEAHADLVLASSPEAADGIAVARTAPVHAIVTRGRGQITAELLDACVGLAAVARCGVGLDNVDVAAAAARGVRVLNLPGSNAGTIAEHTIMLILAVTRGLADWAGRVRDGRWSERTAYDRDEVRGKVLGIVGMGNIGKRVGRIARALEMDVIYADPEERSVPCPRVPLDDLLERADVVSLHCPLDGATRGLVNAAALARLKPGAVLINTARGPLVDRAALASAIASGHLGGFGADVLDGALPERDDALVASANVVITPHVGSLTRTTYREICVQSALNVLEVLGVAPGPKRTMSAR